MITQLTKKQYIRSSIYFEANNDYFIISHNDNLDNDETNEMLKTLKEEETELIEKVCHDLKILSNKQLTEIAYKTEPLKKLKATLNSHKNLNKQLDLKP